MTNHFLHFSTCSEVNQTAIALLQTAEDREPSSMAMEIDPCVHTDSDDDTDIPFDFIVEYPENDADSVLGPDGKANAAMADNVFLQV